MRVTLIVMQPEYKIYINDYSLTLAEANRYAYGLTCKCTGLC